MSEPSDLTRWNRGGLNRFRYVDGNAVEYLEILRQKLAAQFADADSGLCEWLNPPEQVPANEIEAENEGLTQRQRRLSLKQQRMLETYHQDRRDWAWEISRSFARSCHILTENADAYANEGFLGTATQWDHVRRLVEMLDYHPAPPASAYTRIAIEAKTGKSGLLAKGFQLKNSPPSGGKKVIFETLEDLTIDSARNSLRPKGWDQSGDPTVPGDTGEGSEPEELQFSTIAEGSVINLQGVGETWRTALDEFFADRNFKIKDFAILDLVSLPDPGIGEVRLREFKAKATALSYFELEPIWSDIVESLLPEIASQTPQVLAEITGNSLDKVQALQLRIELISAYLDHDIYRVSNLKDLLAPLPISSEPDSVTTAWQVKSKPTVEAGQVAMIYHQSEQMAEAATVAKVDNISGHIDLLPSPVQYSWKTWPRSQAKLFVAPRWQRKCWLNGEYVVRTEQPHGFSEDSFVSWKINDVWKFAKVLEADKRNLRLQISEDSPPIQASLYQARPLEGPNIPAAMEAFGAVTEETLVELVDYTLTVATEASALFALDDPDTSDPGGNVPPLMPPGGLDFGSFLFPSPMLPIDLVKAAVELLLSMGIMIVPSTGEAVFKFLSDPEAAAANIVAKVNDAIATLGGDWLIDPPYDKILELINPPGEETILFKEISSELTEQLERINSPLLGIPKDSPVKALVISSDPLYMFDGSPDKIESGDWLVGRFKDGLRALQLRMLYEYSDSEKNQSFSLSFEKILGNEGELQKIYADFRGELVAEGATINSDPLESNKVELEEVPPGLKTGDEVLLTAEGKEPVAARIESIDGNTIQTNPAPSGFSKGELIILGNVVLAGHGEIKPVKILGSGDATQSNQEFILEVEQVAFTPDATKSSGVAASIEVEVAGRIWQQVSSLKDSKSADHHYAIRMTEQGFVKILFGDGEFGRRLPSGKNNIRVRYRVGSGLAGNLVAHSLEKPVNPHPLVESVMQPMLAAGGGDMENIHSLRENAPPTLLALERAVSLSDFSHLATAQSSVWQAKAFSQILHGGRTENVTIIIVPAGGVRSLDIETDIQSFLQKHVLPGVQVKVENFTSQIFNLDVTIRVDAEQFNHEQVQVSVNAALTEYFTLANRKLGQHLYLSEIYKVVENVEGVENSIAVLQGDSALKVIKADSDYKVIHLDVAQDSTLSVSVEDYLP